MEDRGGAHRDERVFSIPDFLWVLPRPVVPIRHKQINSFWCVYESMKERDGHITPVLAPVVCKNCGKHDTGHAKWEGVHPFGPTRAKVEGRIPVRRQECLPISALYPYPGVYEPKGEEGANRRGERPLQTTGGIQE